MKFIYVFAAKVHYGTSLSNVDWLHGGAESLLTLTNLFVVLGLRNALRKIKNGKKIASEVVSEVQEQKTSVEVPLLSSVKHQLDSLFIMSLLLC